MSIHRELAALVRQAGRGVLADEREFRAAVDDFFPESAITAGELNLLSDAVRLGAHERVRDAVAHGAVVERAIADQAPRLAGLRGTQEQAGARWALEVLAYADGLVDGGTTATPPGAGAVPDPPAHPVSPSAQTAAPTAAPTRAPAPTAPTTPPPAPPTARPPLPSTLWATAPMPPARRRRRWVAAAAVLLVLAAGGGAAVLLAPDDPDGGQPSAGPTGPGAIPAGTIVSADTATIAAAAAPKAMGGRTGGVRVVAFGELRQLGDGDGRVPAEGSRLIGFTLADGPCQAKSCTGWRALGLTVRTGASDVALPPGGPSFAIAVADGADATLHFDADGFDQRLSLSTGQPGPDNIAVLARTPRAVRISGGDQQRTLHGDVTPTSVTIRVDRAELFFFDGTTPAGKADRAYLRVRARYRIAGGAFQVLPIEFVSLERGPRDAYRKKDLGDAGHPDPVFVVPADLARATFVVAGTRNVPSTRGGEASRVDVTLDRATWLITY